MAEEPDGQQVRTLVYRDASRTVVNEVDSPDIGFRWSLNPYRGCEHGCIYCYARPSHEYLNLSCGLDFETKIVAKYEAPALLRSFLSLPRWKREPIVMSGITDPYQPVERVLKITRGCVEAAVEFAQPLRFITKSTLITRDLDLLGALAKKGLVGAAISVTSLDPHLARVMEPRAASPAARLTTIARLREAGVPVSVMTAPIIPGLNDHEIPAILKAAREAGATRAGYVLLRLPYQIKDVFLEWLVRHFPDRAGKVESLIRQARHGALYNSAYFERQRGVGAHAEQIGRTFELFRRRYGYEEPRERRMADELEASKPAAVHQQLELFG